MDTGPGGSGGQPQGESHERHRRRRHYKPRTCRICLDVVEPSFETDTSQVHGFFASKAKVKYVSEEPEGRLICPCQCKGSQKYVHEGCLRAWRAASPLSDRNFWMCPTCRFKYRVERLQWGKWLSSAAARAVLTGLIFLVTIFLLGFIADPIINLWFDPWSTITETVADVWNDGEGLHEPDVDPLTWSYHFTKGFFSLGLLGFLKSFFAMSPWQWYFQVRGGGLGGRRGTGRDRLNNINWFYILLGLITFLGTTWKLLAKFSALALESASDHIIEVQNDDPDESDEDDQVPKTAGSPQESKKDI